MKQICGKRLNTVASHLRLLHQWSNNIALMNEFTFAQRISYQDEELMQLLVLMLALIAGRQQGRWSREQRGNSDATRAKEVN
jgi:hypothetical protein